MFDQVSEEQLEGLKKAFEAMDKEGEGFLSVSKVSLVMETLGRGRSRQEVERAANEEGRVDFEGFVTLMVQSALPLAQETETKRVEKEEERNNQMIEEKQNQSKSRRTLSAVTSATSSSSSSSSSLSNKQHAAEAQHVNGSSGDKMPLPSRQNSIKSATLPAKGSMVWVLGDDHEWRLCKLERVKKPITIHDRKVVELHVFSDDKGTEVMHTHYEDDNEEEYKLVKLSSMFSRELPASSDIYQKLDLSALSVINEPEILHFLRVRYEQKECATFSIGPLTIAFNVHKRAGSGHENEMKKLPHFADNDTLFFQNANVGSLAQKICSAMHRQVKSELPPSKRVNQSVLLLGESGSGKSTYAKEFTQHMIAVLANFNDQRATEAVISEANLIDISCILETFGHARTASNPSSSRFSKSVKFSVDSSNQKWQLSGMLIRGYQLELERVSQCPENECNFNVFYDVFDDIFFSEVAFERYAIEEISSFRYTSTKPPSRLNEPGKSAYKDLTKALSSFLGIPKKEHKHMFGVLGAVLHLGEIELVEGEEVDGNPTVDYSKDALSEAHVEQAAKLLGLSRSALLTVMTKRHVNYAGTVVAKHLSLSESNAARDAVASHLYLSVFKFLLSSINKKLQSLFSSSTKGGVTVDEESFDMLAMRNVIAVYDFPGFEYLKPSTISGLCKNYLNERLFQHFAESVFQQDKAIFMENGISTTSLEFADNKPILRTLDNRRNGVFSICDDQMKLKSRQLDAKVASLLYSQHEKTPCFDVGKKDRKRLWFKIRHFNFSVSYEIKNFKRLNKIQPSAEMVEFLRSSTVPFVNDLLSYCEVRSSLPLPHLHGLEAAPAVEQSVSLTLETSIGRSFSSRPSFNGTPSSRRLMLRQSSSDSVALDDESVMSSGTSATRGTRRGGGGKPMTLASLTQTFVEEVVTELAASKVSVVLCLKPNDVNTCKDFDNLCVSRQLSPYELPKVLRFYQSGYPHIASLSSFSNRYSILSLVHKISGSLSKAFTKMILKCRSLGPSIKVKQSHNLIKSLLNLISNLPELEAEFSVLHPSKADDFYFEVVQTGIHVCETCVMMTSTAYLYLEEAHRIALNLVAHLFQRFYRKQVRPKVIAQMEKVKHVCRGFVARKSWAKKRLAVIKIQSTYRMFVIKSHFDYEKLVLRRIIRAQAIWRGIIQRARLLRDPPRRPQWMQRSAFETPPPAAQDFQSQLGAPLRDAPKESFVRAGRPEFKSKLSHKKSYTTEEEDSNSLSEEEESARPNQQQSKQIEELQLQLDAMKMENKVLRKVEKKFIQQSQSLNAIKEPEVENDSEEEVSEEEESKQLGNRAKIISRQNTENDLQAEKLRCAYEGHRLLPDYDLYSARVLNAVRDDLQYLLKPTVFYKFGHQGSVRKALICVSPCFHYLIWKPKNSMLKKSEECKVDLRKVWSLAKGQTTPSFQEYKGISHGPMPKHLSFSLIFEFRSLDFCAVDEETFKLWFQGLTYIIELINGDSSEAGVDKQYARSLWNSLDKHRSGILSRKQVISLVASLGVKFTNDSFLTAVLRSSIGNSRSDQITFSQFSSLLYQLTRRPELEILWSHILDDLELESGALPLNVGESSDATKLFDVISVSKFRKFWREYQGRHLTVKEARAVIKEGMGAKFNPNFPVLSYAGFQTIMSHEKNDVYDPVKTAHTPSEMSYPLCNYFIATSEGPAVNVPMEDSRDQSSDSFDELDETPFSMDIKRGCRCLELRCCEASLPENDGEFDTDLFVTVASKDASRRRLTFKKVCLDISRVAFAHSHFPLLILLEINASVKLQKRAAKYIEKTFGRSLFLPKDASDGMLPSPRDLKKRVLFFLSSRPSNPTASNSPSKRLSRQMSNQTEEGTVRVLGEDGFEDIMEWSGATATGEETVAVPEMDASLRRICHASSQGRMVSHSLSSTISKLRSSEEAKEEIRHYNSLRLSHVFIDSQVEIDNTYGRMVEAWDAGVPCISVCHEYPSLATKLHHGKFRANGGCGFVPKPLPLRSINEVESGADQWRGQVLVVHVISGQELPDALPDVVAEEDDRSERTGEGRASGFSVVTSLHAAPPVERVEQKTRSLASHGRNPFWNEVFTFSVESLHGQLTLRVFLEDYCQAFASIPLHSLRCGYRSVQLFQEDGEESFQVKSLGHSSLFLRVSLLSADQFQSVRKITRSISADHSSPIKLGSKLPLSSQSCRDFPSECGVIEGRPPLDPVRGKLAFRPTPLAVKSPVALRGAPRPAARAAKDPRRFNLFGQRSLDGIPTARELSGESEGRSVHSALESKSFDTFGTIEEEKDEELEALGIVEEKLAPRLGSLLREESGHERSRRPVDSEEVSLSDQSLPHHSSSSPHSSHHNLRGDKDPHHSSASSHSSHRHLREARDRHHSSSHHSLRDAKDHHHSSSHHHLREARDRHHSSSHHSLRDAKDHHHSSSHHSLRGDKDRHHSSSHHHLREARDHHHSSSHHHLRGDKDHHHSSSHHHLREASDRPRRAYSRSASTQPHPVSLHEKALRRAFTRGESGHRHSRSRSRSPSQDGGGKLPLRFNHQRSSRDVRRSEEEDLHSLQSFGSGDESRPQPGRHRHHRQKSSRGHSVEVDELGKHSRRERHSREDDGVDQRQPWELDI